MTYITDLTVMATMVRDKLRDEQSTLNWGTLADQQMPAVMLGDINIIPSFPAAAVLPQNQSRSIYSSRFFQIIFNVDIIIYHEKIQSGEVTEAEALAQAKQVQDVLHADKVWLDINGAPQVIFSFVARMTPGRAMRNRVEMRATRLAWQAESREQF